MPRAKPPKKKLHKLPPLKLDAALEKQPYPLPEFDEHGEQKNHHGDLPLSRRLTSAKFKPIVAWVKLGHPIAMAAARVGVTKAVVMAWLKLANDETAHPIYRELVAGIDKAAAEYRHERHLAIEGSDDWRAHAWLLERLFPDEYEQKIKHEVEHRVKAELSAVLVVAEQILPTELFTTLLEAVSHPRIGAGAARFEARDDRLPAL